MTDEEVRQAVIDAIRQADYECEMAESVQMPFASWTEHQAEAVLAVPAIADALASTQSETEWGVEVIPGEIRWVSESWLEDGGRPKANGVPLPVYRRTVTHGPWVLDA